MFVRTSLLSQNLVFTKHIADNK